MTPCGELGYKVGDSFEVINKGVFSKGSVVMLSEDDNTDMPRFILIQGHRLTTGGGVGSQAYIHIDELKPYLQDLPTEDFKINLSNMTEAEKSLAKEWLKNVAESRGKVMDIEDYDNHNHLAINSCECVQVAGCKDDTEFSYFAKDLPELCLSFTPPEVRGWELSNKDSEKELKLENLVDKLRAALEEAEEQLQSIKNN